MSTVLCVRWTFEGDRLLAEECLLGLPLMLWAWCTLGFGFDGLTVCSDGLVPLVNFGLLGPDSSVGLAFLV